jgi:hypothetical protein
VSIRPLTCPRRNGLGPRGEGPLPGLIHRRDRNPVANTNFCSESHHETVSPALVLSPPPKLEPVVCSTFFLFLFYL